MNIPVITIDGPTASGKGTIAALVARALGDWHVLDSGALYRLTALACRRAGVSGDDPEQAARLARELDVCFGDGVWLDGEEVSEAIRQEAVGNLASRVAAYPAVREALLARQQAFRRVPGLVADGRDMGTVVFPDAQLKVFLVASAQARAERRYKQLLEKGISANIRDLLEDLQARDARDTGRQAAPLKPAHGARILDSSELSIEETVQQILTWYGNAGVSSPADSRA
ncbi:(d)CMP kinase [Verticiella sediminum]|uniref:Cytidylate kinase n=1 Tax=Verticiella sediminum TaxID=1247510 RepID=A0A556AUP1_9BURK|nr:(d)CMP kinase [Verticiella sediminum]TSH96646.1 (d)CMP kinase [Verticiella sediminum]